MDEQLPRQYVVAQQCWMIHVKDWANLHKLSAKQQHKNLLLLEPSNRLPKMPCTQCTHTCQKGTACGGILIQHENHCYQINNPYYQRKIISAYETIPDFSCSTMTLFAESQTMSKSMSTAQGYMLLFIMKTRLKGKQQFKTYNDLCYITYNRGVTTVGKLCNHPEYDPTTSAADFWT